MSWDDTVSLNWHVNNINSVVNQTLKGMSMREVGICLVGVGRAGTVHASNYAFNLRGARIVAVVDANIDAAKACAEQTGAKLYYSNHEDALRLDEVDAVCISTPTFAHARIAIDAAESGKHVFCEKPMALTLKQADEMISAAKRQHVILQIGFMRRFSPEFRAAKRQLTEGAIGKPTLIKSTGRGPGLPPAWACDPRTSIGMLAEVNSHDFDTARWLMESEVERLYAEAEALVAPELKEKYEDFYDRSVVVLRFRNKALAMIDGACPVKYGYDSRVEILGTEGVMLVGDLKHQAIVTCTKERGACSSFFPSWRDRFSEGYLEEDRHFIDCIVNDREPLASGEDGRAVLELTLAATKSFKTGEPITLPLG